MEGGFFSDGLRRAKAGLQRLTPTKASQQDSDVSPALLARAVTAGAVAGAYAGAVAGATAAAATVHEGLQRKGPNSPAAAQTPAAQSSAWQRTWDASTGAWYYWHTVTRETTWTPPPEFATPSTPATAGDVALDLARTVTLNEYVDKSGFSERTGGASTPSHRPADEPSLYAQDTDIDGSEEVCRRPNSACCAVLPTCLTSFTSAQVDPRVGQALDDMNNSMVTVNELEAALTQAKRRAKQLEAEQRIICQDAYDKLSRGVKEILPAYTRQLLAVQQQQTTQRAFVEYQRAHDAHMAAKAAVAELENRLMATSGAGMTASSFALSGGLALIHSDSNRRRAGRRAASEPMQRFSIASGADRVREAQGGPRACCGGPQAVVAASGTQAGAEDHKRALRACTALHRGQAASRGVAEAMRRAHLSGMQLV